MEGLFLEYSLEVDFDKYDVGRTYFKEGKRCIFDPIREILIVETPEEIIRQKFVRYLIEELKVPKNKIELEVPMSHFKKGAKGRADIIVYGENDEMCDIPIMLIECKAPNIPLVDEVWFQAYKYDYILGAGYIIITNGSVTYGAAWDEEDKEYYFVEELPRYEQLLNDKNFKFIYDESEGWKRTDFSMLTAKSTIEEFIEFGWLGEDTNENLHPFIVNLVGFLFDTTINFAPVNIDGVNIIEDGHRYTSFGNAGGGNFEGDYKYFILEDEECNNQIISMSVFALLKCTDHPRFGNRKGYTTLVVAIDDFDKRHNSLQLNIDKYTEVQGNKYTIWHDGRLTVGRSGSAKRKEVIEFIRNKEPGMVLPNGKIILGTFDCSKEIQWSQDTTKHFIKNLIKYAILRDEFRRFKQRSE